MIRYLAVPLLRDPRAKLIRFALYEETGDELRVVGPERSDRDMPGLVYSESRRLPGYCFRVEDLAEFAQRLADHHGGSVQLRCLDGFPARPIECKPEATA